MTVLRVLLSRIRGLVGGHRRDRDLSEEIEAHLEELTAEHMRRGLSRDDARAAARRAFGGVDQMKERYRDQRGLPFVDALVQDATFAIRTFRRTPSSTAICVLTLALGIGASTAAFSVFNALVLRPLPVSDPDDLVLLQPQRRGQSYLLFNPVFEELRQRQHVLSGVFAVSHSPFLKVTFDGDTAPAYVRASLVSGSYFQVLGLSPSLGRLLTERDDELGATQGATCAGVISHEFWVRRLQQSSGAIGTRFRVREGDCTVVGLAPVSFRSHTSGFIPDLWLPLRPLTDRKLLESRSMAFFSGVMGRRQAGVDGGRAEAEMTALYQQIQVAHAPPALRGESPLRAADFTMRLAPGAQGFDGPRRQFGAPLTIILALVGAVLLIATINVATLLLARGATRLPELATRAALGAGRGRLVRQLATEGSLLAGVGGGLGVIFASFGGPALASLVMALDVSFDRRVMAVAGGATVLAAVLTGIVPALRLSPSALQVGMARGNRTTTPGGQRLTRMLVAAQLALSLLLLTAAGLLLRTMVRVSGIDPGFQPEHVVLLEVRDETPGSSFGVVDTDREKARRAGLYGRLDERLNAIPGVRAASVSWLGMFGGSDLSLRLFDPLQPDDRREGRVDYVSSRYFETIGMRILRGRGFTDRDRDGTPRVAVVNEALARERFGGDAALGRRLTLDYAGERDRPFTVVGVVRDSKYNDLREDRVRPMMWVPMSQAPYRLSSVALRVQPGADAAVAQEAARVLSSTDPQLMVRKTTSLAAQVDQGTRRERLLLGFSSGFGALAVLLACVGLHGTLAHAVSRRTREIGIRLAFGAERGQVLRMVLSDALTLVATGLVAGLPLALAAGYWLRGFLFGVTPLDPAAAAGACALLVMAAVLAAYVPARRAAAVDPITALRYE